MSDSKYFLQQYSYPLLIDEIQYAPNLLPYIEMIVDDEKFKALKNNSNLKSLFWQTGSQQFNVMKDVCESLAGRVSVLNLYSLSNSEINGNKWSLFIPKIDYLKNKSNIKVFDSKEIFKRIYNGGMPSIVTDAIERNNYFFHLT